MKKYFQTPFFLFFALALSLVLFRPEPGWGKTWFPLEFPTPETKTALATLYDGDEVWVGYANYGLVLYDAYGQIKLRITPKDGLPGVTVTDLVKRDKDLWIGTADGLAVRNEGGSLKVITTKDGLPDNGITCLTLHGAVVYAGTLKGLVRFRGDSQEVFTEEKGLPAAHVTALCAYPNGVMIGTPKGWATLSGNTIETHSKEKDGLPFEWISSATYFKYRKAQLSEASNVSDDWFVLGTSGGGLIFFHDKNYTVLKKDDDGPGSDWITCLQFDPVTMKLWVGTQNGLATEDVTDGKWKRYSAMSGGLICDVIKDLSIKSIDEPVKDYEILMGRGKCPSCNAAKAMLASGSLPSPASISTRIGSGTQALTASGSTRVASGTAGTPSVRAASGTVAATASSSANASGTAATNASATLTTDLSHFADGCYVGCPCRPCRWCYSIPPKKIPRILHIPQTWAAIGTEEGAEIYYQKILPHVGQGHIYSYASNLGYEAKGIGVGTQVFAGMYPPGAGDGFLFAFAPQQISFGACYANPLETKFSSVINTLNTTTEGYPVAGGYSLGRGGLAILDIPMTETPTLMNPWKVYGSKEGLTDLNVTCIYREGPTLLVGTGMLGKSGSVFRFKDGKYETFPKAGLKHANQTSMFRAPVTCLWGDGQVAYVGTKDDGFYYFDGNSWTRYDTFSHKTLQSDSIQAITFRDNVLYVGTKKGLDCFSPTLTTHINITDFSAYTNEVQSLLWDDSDGDGLEMVLWVGYKDGFSRVATQLSVMVHGGKGRSQATMGGFPWPGNPPSVVQIFSDNYPGNRCEDSLDECPFDGLPGNDIHSMAYDDINLWIGTDNGICRFRK